MKFEQPRNPADLSSRDDVHVATNRCPSCHEDVEIESADWVSCFTCQARHHRACGEEFGACGSCGGTRFLVEASLESAERAQPSPQRGLSPRALLLCGGLFVLAGALLIGLELLGGVLYQERGNLLWFGVLIVLGAGPWFFGAWLKWLRNRWT